MKNPTIRDVLYVLGNDLHRGRVRHARLVNVYPDQSADLVVFAPDSDEALNECGHDRASDGVFVKRRVAYDGGKLDEKGNTSFKASSWHEDPDSPLEVLASSLEQQADSLAALAKRVAGLEQAVASKPEPTPATAAPSAPPAAA